MAVTRMEEKTRDGSVTFDLDPVMAIVTNVVLVNKLARSLT